MSKYAPANDAGEKPYIVTLQSWGREDRRIIWANSPSEARQAIGRQGVGTYVKDVRRALIDEVSS